MKNSAVIFLLAASLLAGACSKTQPDADPEPLQNRPIRIAPQLLTRVTDTDFESGDAVGVTLQRSSGACYLDNIVFRFDGTQFTAEAAWYDEPADAATLLACYPYQPDGLPQQFTVRSDQRGEGYDASNLIGARSTGVTPTADPVKMEFRHLLARIDIEVESTAPTPVGQIVLSGMLPTASVDWAQLRVADPSGEPARIVAHERTAGSRYVLLLPPQRTAMQVEVATGGKTLTRQLVELELLQGHRYTLRLAVDAEQEELKLVVKGDIVNWEEGGTIGGVPDSDSGESGKNDKPGSGDSGNSGDSGDPTDPSDPSDPSDPATPEEGAEGTLLLDGESYRTKVVGGQEWMAENLRYIPSGAANKRDFFYPNTYSDAQAHDPARGLLYTYATAAGGSDSAQGICPEGWRLPTGDELTALAAAAGRDFFTESGYFYNLEDGPSYNANQSYVMSGTLTGSKVTYLRINATGAPVTASFATGSIAASVRCVKAR